MKMQWSDLQLCHTASNHSQDWIYSTEFTKHKNPAGPPSKKSIEFHFLCSSSYEPFASDKNNATVALMMTFLAAALVFTSYFGLFLICLIFFNSHSGWLLLHPAHLVSLLQQKTSGYMIHWTFKTDWEGRLFEAWQGGRAGSHEMKPELSSWCVKQYFIISDTWTIHLSAPTSACDQVTAKVWCLKGECESNGGENVGLVRQGRMKKETKIVRRAPRVEGRIPKLSHMSGRAAAESETGVDLWKRGRASRRHADHHRHCLAAPHRGGAGAGDLASLTMEQNPLVWWRHLWWELPLPACTSPGAGWPLPRWWSSGRPPPPDGPLWPDGPSGSPHWASRPHTCL